MRLFLCVNDSAINLLGGAFGTDFARSSKGCVISCFYTQGDTRYGFWVFRQGVVIYWVRGGVLGGGSVSTCLYFRATGMVWARNEVG